MELFCNTETMYLLTAYSVTGMAVKTTEKQRREKVVMAVAETAPGVRWRLCFLIAVTQSLTEVIEEKDDVFVLLITQPV